MKYSRLFVIILIFFFSCNNSSDTKEEAKQENKVLNGKYVTRNKNGKLSKIAYYKDNKLHGVQESYNNSGILQNTITYDNGVRSGKAVIYYENGKEYRISNYKDNKINGIRTKYRKTGKLWSIQSYYNSLPSNDLVEYTDYGKEKSKPQFIIKHENRIEDLGIYSLKLSVKGTYKSVKYYIGGLDENLCFNVKTATPVSEQYKSKGEYIIFTTKNSSRIKSHNLIAQVKTHANNSYLLHRRIDLAL